MSIIFRKKSNTVVSLSDYHNEMLIAFYSDGELLFIEKTKQYIEIYSEQTLKDMCKFVLEHGENWFSIGNFGSD